jgi:hypothetical protein
MKATLVFLLTFTLSYCSIFSQAVGDFRSFATGNWNVVTTWERFNGVSWINPAPSTPIQSDGVITIQSGHTVTINAVLTIDQVVVNSGATLTNTGGTLLSFNNSALPAGSSELIVNGTFIENGSTSVVFNGGATWNLGANGTYVKTRNTGSNVWQNAYEGGISTIPATSNWILRKVAAAQPQITTIGAFYGNLIFENTIAGTWTTTAGASFQGAGGFPTIKGNFDLGGAGAFPIVFLNSQTNVQPSLVLGNFLVRAGNTFQNYGTGLEVQGNFTNNGTISYDANDARRIVFSGANAQTLTNTGTLGIYDLTMNKSANTLTLNSPIVIDNVGTFTNGIMNSTAVNLPTFNTAATTVGASNSSFVSGPVRVINPAAFDFPVGKVSSYRKIGISATAVTGGPFWTETFNNGCTGAGLCFATGVNTGNGAWSIDNSPGPLGECNGGISNQWYVSCAEDGSPAIGACGAACAGNATLHVSGHFDWSGDIGAAYEIGGIGTGCADGFSALTYTRAVSPLISTVGKTNISLNFKYIENGQGATDDGWVEYSTDGGATWSLLVNPAKSLTGCCVFGSCQGIWTNIPTIALPVSAENIPNFRLRFIWKNNDDGGGADPSFAIDNLTLSTPTNVVDFTAEYFPANPQIPYGNVLVPTLNSLSNCEYWILNRNAGTENKQVTLSWNAASCYNTAFASFEVARWDNISGIWQDHDGIVAGTAAGGTVVTPAVVTSFSPFAIAYVPLPLPVEMENISITCDDGTGVLKWTTASEINNDHFSIERSIDAMTWQEINRVPGAGNSNTELSYSWVDLDPINNGYYRLKQVDFDGKFKIYDPLHLSCISKQNWINLYPNPSTGTVNIEISSGSHLEAIMIYSSLGQFHSNVAMNGIQGKSILPVDVSFLEPGMYYLRMLVNGEWLTRPVVIIQ